MPDILNYDANGPLQKTLRKVDQVIWGIGGLYQTVTNICLFLMLLLTTVTILARPLDLSFYWIWPWTMVLFIWLCFFGFCAFFIRLKDVRIDLVASRFGRFGMVSTRILADVCALAISYVVLVQFSTVMETSRGIVDGAIIPGGHELPRQALSVPMFLSFIVIFISSILDFLKLILGLPENLPEPIEDN